MAAKGSARSSISGNSNPYMTCWVECVRLAEPGRRSGLPGAENSDIPEFADDLGDRPRFQTLGQAAATRPRASSARWRWMM